MIKRLESKGVAELRARLERPEAFLSRTDLRDLGLERRAVDAVFRALPVVELPGYSRPLVRVCDYQLLLERSTYGRLVERDGRMVKVDDRVRG